MKSLRSLSILIVWFCYTSTPLQAQGLRFENVVNEQFGTLLESLLKDGKLDETSAKTYLETVFGYDEAVGSYVKTINFGQQLKNLGQGKMSFDSYLTSLSHNLLSLIPQEKQQAYFSHMQNQYMMEGALNELKSGQIGANTLQLTSGILQGLKDAKEEKIRNETIAKKLEIITPTISKLAASHKDHKKLKIIDEVESNLNWIENKNPIVLDRPNYPTLQFTSNYTALQNGYLLVSSQNYFSGLDWEKKAVFEPIRIYRNPEKFDFSEDFRMDIYIRIPKSQTRLELEVGKGFKIFVQRANGQLIITTPLEYSVTEKYGNLKEKEHRGLYDGRRVDADRGIFLGAKSGMTITERKNADIDFEQPLKLTITKKEATFSCAFNDLPYAVTRKINYFPDKYYIGIALKAPDKKTFVEIHKLELAHL